MIAIINCGYSSIEKLEDLVDISSDYQTFPIFDVDREEIKAIQPIGIVISHAHFSINEVNPEKYITKIQELLTLKLPLLGIGVGHHLLGVALGAQVSYQAYKNELVEIGIIAESELFSKLPDEIHMIKDNAGTISIPPHFELLANSDWSINEAMKKIDEPIFGTQFILEVSGNHGAVIMENFVNISQQHASKQS
ncbi:MAG TPA: hypothetical protein VKX31_06045 [Brumimicrobium sp.]|nr:hypothetical protein [Brumimicrobium sp.]